MERKAWCCPRAPKSSSASQQVFQPSRTPEVAVADAMGEVKKLEEAISAHGRTASMPKSPRSLTDCPEQEQVALSVGTGGVVQEIFGLGRAEGVA